MATYDDIAVLTSENVRLTYTLAGLGSRLAAFIIDSIIILLLWVAISGFFYAFGLRVADLDFAQAGSMKMSFLAAAYIFLTTALIWGYFFFFEWINWGQTPGKEIMNIRVSMANGAPAELYSCAIRNLIRFIDILFSFMGITVFVMIFAPRYQRLGDLVAGTVVVKRRRLVFDDVLAASRAADERAKREGGMKTGKISLRLTEAEKSVVVKFLERRDSLPADVRKRLAKDLADKLRANANSQVINELGDEELLEEAGEAG